MTTKIVETQTKLEETEEDQLHSGGETEGSEFAASYDEHEKTRKKRKRKKMPSPEKETIKSNVIIGSFNTYYPVIKFDFMVSSPDPMVHSKWRSMNVIQCLQYGLSQGLHKNRDGFGNA
jgi:hypothetical protein